MFEAVIGEIKKYGRIIIHRHTNPDGDAIGSQVGLKHIIKEKKWRQSMNWRGII